jgi:hypothetical protein
MSDSTETRAYTCITGTQTFNGFKGLRVDQRYIGVPQKDGQVLVVAVGAQVGTGVRLNSEEWEKWFKKYKAPAGEIGAFLGYKRLTKSNFVASW